MPLSKQNESNMNVHDSTSKIIKINIKLKSKVVYVKIKIESKRSCTWAWSSTLCFEDGHLWVDNWSRSWSPELQTFNLFNLNFETTHIALHDEWHMSKNT